MIKFAIKIKTNEIELFTIFSMMKKYEMNCFFYIYIYFFIFNEQKIDFKIE